MKTRTLSARQEIIDALSSSPAVINTPIVLT